MYSSQEIKPRFEVSATLKRIENCERAIFDILSRGAIASTNESGSRNLGRVRQIESLLHEPGIQSSSSYSTDLLLASNSHFRVCVEGSSPSLELGLWSDSMLYA